MAKYVIERTIPGIGGMSPDQLQGISAESVKVLRTLDGVEWLHSYVTGDKLYCVYETGDPGLIEEHARCGGFPLDTLSEVRTMISPATAEGA